MPQFVSSKNLLQSAHPLVVGAVSRSETLAQLGTIEGLADACDLLELRLDSLELPAAEIHAHARSLPLPLLITARHPEEGGDGNLSATSRAALLDSHLDIAALMDVELRSAMDLQGVIAKARTRAVGVI